ncbi:MAG: zinc ribbon domain-containing protein [Anaerolineaceae bacterium]|nr:zinc ribbon domain-containing protein [Anaerolineaceae bacterium]
MAQKSKGFIKLEWICSNCQTNNPGPDKLCNGCGSPQPENVEFHQAGKSQLITDNEEIESIKSGPDIHCPYCETRNPSGNKICIQCGGDLVEGKKREAGRVIGAFQTDTTKDIKCPNCGALNSPSNQNCAECGGSIKYDDHKEKVKPAPIKKAIKKKRPVWLIIPILIIIAICIVIFILFSTRRSETGVVQSVHWTRTIQIENFGPVIKEAWENDIPSDADITGCEKAYHHTSSEPEPVSTEICGTPYVVDEGTGIGEVVEDCEYEVYSDWCTYSIDEWYLFDNISQEGNDFNPQWPEIQLGADQRNGDMTEGYEIYFSTSDATYSYSTNDQDLFFQSKIGTEWELSINALNMLVDISPVQ